MDDKKVIWEGHTVQVSEAEEQAQMAALCADDNPPPRPETTAKKLGKKKKRKAAVGNSNCDQTEDCAAQVKKVKKRFRRGCECRSVSCFRGLSAESVYQHRLNKAKLTNEEHDMYLMGVTMACLANPDTTVHNKERRRLHTQHVYQGRRVCLDAFMYLENCTNYQLKRIRKHVMTHGVVPRVHGNRGKKPSHPSLVIYKHATEFLKQYLEIHTGESYTSTYKQVIELPCDITRKKLHAAYKEHGQVLDPGIKLMGYSCFRNFMKQQFPNVTFCKVEPKSTISLIQKIQQEQNLRNQVVQQQTNTDNGEFMQTPVITSEERQQGFPLVIAKNENGTVQYHQQAALLVPPIPQLIQNTNLVGEPSSSNEFTNTSYVVNEQGNLTIANPQDHPPYTFDIM